VDFVQRSECLGGAGNVGVNIAALGAHVEMFGVVGARGKNDDEPGVALRACLRAAHIGVKGVLADASRVTTVKTRVIARHQQIVRIDHERREPLTKATEEKLLHGLFAAAKKLDALVLSDYDKGLVNDELGDRELSACHKLKVPVFVKPKTSRLYAYPGEMGIGCNAIGAGFFRVPWLGYG